MFKTSNWNFLWICRNHITGNQTQYSALYSLVIITFGQQKKATEKHSIQNMRRFFSSSENNWQFVKFCSDFFLDKASIKLLQRFYLKVFFFKNEFRKLFFFVCGTKSVFFSSRFMMTDQFKVESFCSKEERKNKNIVSFFFLYLESWIFKDHRFR